jgi:hypothetical protein
VVLPDPHVPRHARPARRQHRRRRRVRQFTDASPAQALAQASAAAAGADIRIGGGPSTIREFLGAGLIDYLHVVVVPIVLERGERLWDGLEALEGNFQIETVTSPSGVTHVTFSRRLRTAAGHLLDHGRYASGRSHSTPPRRAVSCPAAAAASAAPSRDTYAFVRGKLRSEV